MTENHSKINPGALATAFGDANDLASVWKVVPGELGACLGCPGVLFGQLLTALGSSGATQDRLWGNIWASKSCPEHVRTRPRNGFGAQNGPRWIFRRFGGHPARIFVDFRMLFRRFSFEPSATKRQNRNLKKESCDPHQPTWLLRCAVAQCSSHVFRNDCRTLHVQPFVMRTHKPT